jgi:transposase
MYIRRTTIKSRRGGEAYFTHRLVESIRTAEGVRQRTLVNLGRHFEVPQEQWAGLAQRIEQILGGQSDLFPVDLERRWEAAAQRYAALVIKARASWGESSAGVNRPDYHTVDVNTLELMRPRSVSLEHVALEAVRQLGLDTELGALGLNGVQQMAVLGTLIGRLVNPGSELATHQWLQQRSGLGELLGYDFERLPLKRLYQAADQLWRHKEALEQFLFAREQELFDLDNIITLYDLTNTYFEGQSKANAQAALGHSKEKRSDCPLVTLALVLDGSGFVKKSAILPGNVSEPNTLALMIEHLCAKDSTQAPTVVLDAGLATEENVAWLKAQPYRYIVVSRQRHRQFDVPQAVTVRDEGTQCIRIQRVVNAETEEVERYCHSAQREQKERAIDERLAQRFETELRKLEEGLHKKRTVKRYDKILQRLGRFKQKYPRVAQYYAIEVEHDTASTKVTAITWRRTTSTEATHPGVYCLRTNQDQWDEATLWHTYTMLTDLEAVFRALKSELGLRPVFHYKTARVSAHLFISVLAYHLVHTIRFQLKAFNIHLSWEGIRRALEGQDRITVQLQRADGKTLHVRKTTRAEPRQQLIYDALGISDRPGRTEKTMI